LKRENPSSAAVAASALVGGGLVVGEKVVGVVWVGGKAAVGETGVSVFFDPHEARTSAEETSTRINRFPKLSFIPISEKTQRHTI
jgi:hypothetical protein